MAPGMSVFNSNTGVTTVKPAPPPPPLRPEKAELNQSYLGIVPPAQFIMAKVVGLTAHVSGIAVMNQICVQDEAHEAITGFELTNDGFMTGLARSHKVDEFRTRFEVLSAQEVEQH
ncbi:SWI/SNF chromatin remodeling complex [Mycena venus]|uniref:SWI/SNF chromatin remodeling complex n=1 Tax=Mycena venus TaxID=2733690 RepID=A0A8H7D1S4_9AGAR|nr:SWI/SNF chromatin remodeling complex [Mycena venus]